MFSDLHTPSTVWFAIGRTVSASSGTGLPTLQQLHSRLGFLYVVFFGQCFSCRWNHFLYQEYSTRVTKEDFFCLPLIHGPLPYFPSSAYMKGSLSCPVWIGHRPKGFHRNRDLLLSVKTQSLMKKSFQPTVTAQRQRMGHAATLGEVERVLETTQQDRGGTRNKSQIV